MIIFDIYVMLFHQRKRASFITQKDRRKKKKKRKKEKEKTKMFRQMSN